MSCEISKIVEELRDAKVAPWLSDKQLTEMVSSKILSRRVDNIIDDADIDKTKVRPKAKTVNKPVAKLGTPRTAGALQAAALIKELVRTGEVRVYAADGVNSNFSSKDNTIKVTDKDAGDNEALAKLLLYKATAGMTYDTLSDKTKETLGKIKEFILSDEYAKYDKYTLESLRGLDRKDAELAYLRIMAKEIDAKFTREAIAVLGSSSGARSDLYSKFKSKKTMFEAFNDIIAKLKKMGEFVKSLLAGSDAKFMNNKEYLNFVEAVNEVMNQEPALVGDKAVLDMLSKVDGSKIVPYKSGTNALYTMRSRYNIVKSFGNPFMTAEGGVETQVDKKVGNNDEVSVMYYKWLKDNTIPSNYKGDLKLLNDRRTYILSNLDKVRDAKELAYSGTAKDSDVNHVKALLAIANDKTQPSTGYTVTPKDNVPDAEKIKSVFKASKATKYIGFGQDGSSTKRYGEQLTKQGMPINVGTYTKNDIVFVSVNGTPSKEDFTNTLEQTITALESGATILTDSEAYLAASTYNKGEQQLAKVLLDRGYKRSIAKGNANTAIWTKATTISGKDHISKSDKVIVGDIFDNLENGVIIVTTNLGGVHGAGLAGQAKGKGLLKQHENREFSESPLDKNVITIAVKGKEPGTVEGQYKTYSENRFAEKVVGKNIDLLKDEMRKLYKYAKQETDTKFYIPLVGMGFGEGDPKTIVPVIAEMLKLDNVQLVVPTADILSKSAKGVKARVDDTTNHLESTMDMVYAALDAPTNTVHGAPVAEPNKREGANNIIEDIFTEENRLSALDILERRGPQMVYNMLQSKVGITDDKMSDEEFDNIQARKNALNDKFRELGMKDDVRTITKSLINKLFGFTEDQSSRYNLQGSKDMVANVDQKKLIDQAVQFITKAVDSTEESFLTVQGMGGTGKSTTIGRAIELVAMDSTKPIRFIGAAFTHTAKNVLIDMTKSMSKSENANSITPTVSTLQSMMGKVVREVPKGKETQYTRDKATGLYVRTGKFSLLSFLTDDRQLSVIVIDEVSMLSEDDILNLYAHINVARAQNPYASPKVILMGDYHQLPAISDKTIISPVLAATVGIRSSKNHIVNSIINKGENTELKIQQRQKEGSVLLSVIQNAAVNVEKYVKGTFKVKLDSSKTNTFTNGVNGTEDVMFEEYERGVVGRYSESLWSKIIADFKTAGHKTKFISFNNDALAKFNQELRVRLFGDKSKAHLIPGDTVMLFSNFNSGGITDANYTNGLQFKIRSVKPLAKPADTRSRLASITYGRDLTELYYKNDVKMQAIELEALSPDTDDVAINIPVGLFDEMYRLLNDPREKGNMDDIYAKALSRFTEVRGSTKFVKAPSDMIGNENLNMNDRVVVPFNYGYGLTSYKAQGQTIDNVYFDSSSRIAGSNTELRLSMSDYTAVSRAKKKLTIIGNLPALKAKFGFSGRKEDNKYYQSDSTMQKMKDNEALASVIKDRLAEQYPNIPATEVETLADADGNPVLGRAIGAAIEYSKNASIDTIPHEYAHVYVNILKNTPLVKNLIKSIAANKNMSLEAAEEYLVDIMGKKYVKKVNETALSRGIDKLWNMIKDFFSDSKIEAMNDSINLLADRFYNGVNADAISMKPKDGYSLVDTEKTFSDQPFAASVLKDIMSTVGKGKALFTGSAALALQGTVYRKGKDGITDLHDLDVIVDSAETREKLKKHIEDNYSSTVFYDFKVTHDSTTDHITTLAVLDNGHSVDAKSIVRGMSNRVVGYNVIDSKGNVVGTYAATLSKNTGEIVKEDTIGVKAVLVDLLQGRTTEEYTMYNSPKLGVGIALAAPKHIFTAKFKILTEEKTNRNKDIADAVLFKENDNKATTKPEDGTIVYKGKVTLADVLAEGCK